MSQVVKYYNNEVLTITGDIGGAISPDITGNLDFLGGANINTAGTPGTITINLDADIDLTSVKALTFDTNVAAAGVTLSGTSLTADGTDANIDINITAKGTGQVIIDDLQLTSPLGIASGGTNSNAMATTYGVNYFDGASIVTTAVGTATHVLTSNGVGIAPTFQLSGGGVQTLTAGTNINLTGTAADPIVNLDAAITLTTVNTTNLTASSLGRGIVQSDATGLLSSSEGTDGQIIVSSSAGAPAFANITSTTIDITNGANTIAAETFSVLQSDTGFESWIDAGNYYDDTTLGSFEILRGGTGYIKGVPVTWAGAQTVIGMTSGNAYYIYVDDTGTIGKTDTRTDAIYEDYIVLFQCWRDAKLPTNNQKTVKENHPFAFPVHSSNYLHNTVGSVIENFQKGANITLNGTQKIEISGADELDDHGLETIIPDSGGVAETFAHLYTNADGKWVIEHASDTFHAEYNNAGTVTALGLNKHGIYTLYVGKDDLNTTTPRYGAVMDDSQYNNLAAANLAIANGTMAIATNELAVMENCRLGYIIFSEASNSIVNVFIDKNTLRSSNSTSGTNIASLISTDITNFDGILSAADTNVQSALETLDDYTVDLTADVTGALPIINGGTNANAMVNTYGVNYFDGTSIVTTAVGTATHVLTSNGAGAAPTFQADAGATFCSDAEAIAGTEAAKAVAPLTLKAKLGTQTSHGIAYGAGTTGAVAWTAEMSDGQVIVGDTGGIPIPATLTGEHGIEITNAAGSIKVGNKLTINAQTGTSYITVIGDQNAFITMTNAAASTLTIPPHSDVAYDVGCVIYVQQLGAGQLTLTSGAGVTFKSADDAYKLCKQNSCAAVIQTIQDQWCIAGDVEA